MGSVHTCQQYGSEKTIAQQTHTAPYTQPHRNQKGEPAEHKAFRPVLLKILHIHLKTGEKHDIIKPDFTEQFETAITVEHMKAMLSNQYPRQNHAYNMRYMKPSENHRSKKNNNQHQKKHPSRIRNWQR